MRPKNELGTSLFQSPSEELRRLRTENEDLRARIGGFEQFTMMDNEKGRFEKQIEIEQLRLEVKDLKRAAVRREADYEESREQFARANVKNWRLQNQVKDLTEKLARCNCRHRGGIVGFPPAKVVVISDDEEMEDVEQKFNIVDMPTPNSTSTRIERVRSVSPDVEIIEIEVANANDESSFPKKRRKLSPKLSSAKVDQRYAYSDHVIDPSDQGLHADAVVPGRPENTSNIQLGLMHANLDKQLDEKQHYLSSPSTSTPSVSLLVPNFSHSLLEPSSRQHQQSTPLESLPPSRSSFVPHFEVELQSDFPAQVSSASTHAGSDNTDTQYSRAAYASLIQNETIAHMVQTEMIEGSSAPVKQSVLGASPHSGSGGLAHLLHKSGHVNGGSDEHTKIADESVAAPASSHLESASVLSASSSHSSPLPSAGPTSHYPSATIDHDTEMTPALKAQSDNSISAVCERPILDTGVEDVKQTRKAVDLVVQPASMGIPPSQFIAPTSKKYRKFQNKACIFESPACPSASFVKNEDRRNAACCDEEGFGRYVFASATKTKRLSSNKTPRLSTVPRIQALDPLWVEAVSVFLRETPSINIDIAPDLNFRVSRALLSKKYKISTGSFRAIVKSHRNPSSTPDTPRVRSILFPFYEENPDLPPKPGDPGIILTKRTDIFEVQPATIFINYDGRGKTPSVWLYAGEYTLEKCAELTGKQFSRQPKKTQERWGRTIITLKRDDVWASMRARIYLRKHNIPLTEENVHGERIKIQASKGKPGPLEIQDVIDAFVRGDERLDIIRMKCVAYDRTFVEDLRTEKIEPEDLETKGTTAQPKKKRPRKEAEAKSDRIAVGSTQEASSSSGSKLRRSDRERRPSARAILDMNEMDSDGSVSALTDYDYSDDSEQRGDD